MLLQKSRMSSFQIMFPNLPVFFLLYGIPSFKPITHFFSKTNAFLLKLATNMDRPTLNCLAFETLATACINSNDYDLAIKVKLELTKHIQLTMNSVSTREKLLQLGRLFRADLRISKFIITKIRNELVLNNLPP